MRKIAAISTAILLWAGFALGQSQATTGNIEGRVTDQNGAVVPGIAISVTNQDTGFGKTAVTNDDGTFIFLLLPPGNYRAEVAATKGFAAATYQNIKVTVGAKTPLDISLSAGGASVLVDVTDEGQPVETTRTSIASTVDERRVINLPTNGRNFLDFATLTPGVVRDPTRAGDLAVGGQKGTLNSLQIDGASSDNTFFGQSSGRIGSGRAPSQFSVDTVKEFQVNQNGFSAEFGRAAGAVINVVTKSGTNKFRGSAFEYFRDESLNAKNPSFTPARPKPFGQINQFGGTLGGPIVKDKAFFFAAYEGQRSDLPNPVILGSVTTAPAAVQTFLAPKLDFYNIDRVQDTFLAKVDLNINDRNQVWVRFNQQNFKGTNLEASGTLSAEEHTGNSNVKTSTVTTNWTATISPKWFNEFRFQYSRDRQPGLANTNDPEVNITVSEGTFSFGRNNFSPRETTINRLQFINNQTLVAGNHTIKYGADLLFDRIFNFFPGLFGGSYSFRSYATFNTRTPFRYRQSFAGTGTTGAETHPNNNEYGFFLQDDWRASQKLTINLGLRYDYQNIAKPPVRNPNTALLAAGFDTSFQPKDRNNFGPRFGISYAFNEKTVLRGGYGIYYGRTPAIITGTAHSQNGIQVIAIDINCETSPALCPTFPNIFSSIPTNVAAVTPNLYLFSPNYKQPYTEQARVQFERELWKNTTFGFHYMMYRGHDLTRTRNANLNSPVNTTYAVYNGTGATATPTGETFTFQRFAGAGYAGPRVAGFGRISLFESTAKSFYQGVTFEFNRRFANRWQFSSNYTLSKAKDNKPDQTSVVVGGGDDAKIAQNQFDLSGEYGRSDLDVRHRFVASTVYETGTFKYSSNKVLRALFSDYIFTGIFTAQSGIAFSAAVTGDPNGDGNTANDRLPGTARNQFSTPSAYIFDVRVGRVIRFGERFRISLFAEGFNIFNRANVFAVNNTVYSLSGVTGALPVRLVPPAATTPFQSPRQFFSGSPSFTFNSSYNRELQLGIRLDF